MSTTLAVVVLAAGLACPAHMAWSRWRGRKTHCAPSGEASLAERQRQLAARVDALAQSRGDRA